MLSRVAVVLVVATSAVAAPAAKDRAESAEHASRWADAASAWTDVTAANPTNGTFWSALGADRKRAADLRGAIAAYEHAIELGDAPADAAYAIAACELQLGDHEAAIAALTRAFALGYRYLETARSDAELAGLHGDARFAALVGLPAQPFASRDAGWRFDLALVAREIHRRGAGRIPADLDSRVAALIASIEKRSDDQLVVELVRLLRDVGDGHTGLLGVRRAEFAWALPLSFYELGDDVYVIAADPKYRELVGDKLERIDGHATRDVLGALDPLISRDNAMWPKAMAPLRLRSTAVLHALGLVADPRHATLSVVDAAGARRDVAVDADQAHPDIWNQLPYPAGWVGLPRASREPRDNDVAYWLERDAAHHLVYVQYNRVADADKLAAFGARVVSAVAAGDRLVIDLRHNNGGDTYANEPLLHALERIPDLDRRGRMFVIIGRRTFSAALNAAAYLERRFHPIFVGEPTGGKPNSPGDEVPFSLPYSGAIVNVSDRYWQSGWPDDHRVWIAPEIYVPPTIEAARAGTDPAMAAIEQFPR